jgi:hypothetical protein
MRTNEEIRQVLEDFGPERWLEALESGAYQHMAGQLGQRPIGDDEPIQACCIGVLCDAAGLASYVNKDRGEMQVLAYQCHPRTGKLDWRDLPSWMTDDDQRDLMRINDTVGVHDYVKQAEVIRTELLPVWQQRVAAAAV